MTGETHPHRLDTRLVHAGEPHPRIHGAVTVPVFMTAMYEYESCERDSHDDIPYIRLNNSPNHLVLHRKLAVLEGAEAALVTGSGMAAITTALLEVLRAGDHLLIQDTLYGGTHEFVLKDLPAAGVETTFIDGRAPDSWASALRPNTRAIYVEALTNPLLQVADLEAVTAFARAHDLVSLVDNTFPSPVNYRPAEHGFDLSLHSGTKYLNGHSDIAAGAVIGRAGLVGRITRKLNRLGGTLDPHACFLLQRGLMTLALRVRHQNASAQALAGFLAAHPAVARVNYPGLPDHPDHQRARRLFDGFGGMLSFELAGGLEAAKRLLERVQLPVVAPSLGSVHSLLTRPAATSHTGVDPELRRRLGITDGLIRMSVGVEAVEDLIADLDQALAG